MTGDKQRPNFVTFRLTGDKLRPNFVTWRLSPAPSDKGRRRS